MKRLLLIICALTAVSIGFSQTFEDMSEEMELQYSYGGCFLAGGISFTDYNGDGIDDLLLPSCVMEPFYVYQGDGEGFEKVEIPVLIDDSTETKAIYAVDLDNDGDREIFACHLFEPDRLYWNNAGEYVDVSEAAGLTDISYATFCATFGDYDKDGFLDIYVGNRATTVESMQNFLYHNNGDGTFESVGVEAGVSDSWGAALAVAFWDYDNDSWPDIYIANDKLTGNRLFRNLGDGTFEDVSEETGSDLEMDGMSVSLTDYNNDGWKDIYITNTHVWKNKFLISNGDGTFTEMAEDLGVGVGKWCWGSNFIDYDLDGDEDLFVPSIIPPVDNSNTFFMRFQDQYIDWSDESIPIYTSICYGSAKADYDQDGDYDLVVLSGGGNTLDLLQNQQEDGNHYVAIDLVGTISNAEAVGSQVAVTAGDLVQNRELTLGANFAAQDSHRLIFGIGDADTAFVHIDWPSGLFMDTVLTANADVTIIEQIPTAVDHLIDLEILVAPNPVRDVLRVEVPEQMHGYSIYSSSGKLIGEAIWNDPFPFATIDMSAFTPGIYQLIIHSKRGNGSVLVVRE